MTNIKIKGGNYRWIDTQDGYFTVLDVPLVSEWKTGDHGAPYAGTKEVLDEFVTTAQQRYNDGKFCATAYVQHNPDLPITKPDFAGYVLPNRVGKYKLEKGEKWTVFGDIKLSAGKFADAKAGKIPYASVEIPWLKRRIRGIAFLDTLPPQYEYALFTIGDEVKDSTAKFAVDEEKSAAQFMDDEKKHDESVPHKEPDGDEVEKKIVSHMEKHLPGMVAKHMAEHGTKYASEMIAKHGRMAAIDPLVRKPDALPAEPNRIKEGGAQMNVDPEFAAKFAAQANEIAELKTWRTEQENDKKAAALVAKADQAMAGKIVTPALKEQIASFAADAVKREGGEAWFDKMLEALKPSLKEKPIGPIGAFSVGKLSAPSPAASDANDPIVAKFAQDGPESMEEAAKFAAQWKELKRLFGDRMVTGEEDFIRNEIGLAKAKRDGLFMENGR